MSEVFVVDRRVPLINYRKKNKELIREINKRYYEANKEKIRINKKKYGEENREKIRINKKKYREANKEKINLQSRLNYKKRKLNNQNSLNT